MILKKISRILLMFECSHPPNAMWSINLCLNHIHPHHFFTLRVCLIFFSNSFKFSSVEAIFFAVDKVYFDNLPLSVFFCSQNMAMRKCICRNPQGFD